MKRCTFHIGNIEVHSEWNAAETAEHLYAALPIDAHGHYWGGAIYCEIPVQLPLETDAGDVVEPGTVAYWPTGHCLCIFWGPTPANRGGECRAASEVNIVGRVLNPEVLPTLTASDVGVTPS